MSWGIAILAGAGLGVVLVLGLGYLSMRCQDGSAEVSW